jgi:S1-C subfamily serine protease
MTENSVKNNNAINELDVVETNQEKIEIPQEDLVSKEGLPSEVVEPDNAVEEILKRIESQVQENNLELRNIDRKYHNEFANVISNQQAELDGYREGLGKSALNGILKTICYLYSDYESYIDFDDAIKLKKGLNALLNELLQLAHENSVLEYKSVIGGKYSVKHCKVIEKVKTKSKELHSTVIESRNTGFIVGNIVLVPERVKIYVYDEQYMNEGTEE